MPQCLEAEAQTEAMTRVCGIQSLLDGFGQVSWVRVVMRSKNPSGSRDLGRLKRAESNTSADALKLGLAVGDNEFFSRVKAQEDRNEKGGKASRVSRRPSKYFSSWERVFPKVEPDLRTSASLERGRP